MVSDRIPGTGFGSHESGALLLRRPRVVSPEELTLDQQNYAERLVRAVIPGGVLTGAVLGLSDWDVRPLVLSQGAVHLIRSSDPELSHHSAAYQGLKSATERARAAQVPCSWGELPHPTKPTLRQIWMKRRYYGTLLSEHPGLHGEERVQLVQGLFTRLSLLQRYGVIHGHVCASNIALEGESIVLLDHFFGTYDLAARQVRTDLAKEIRGGAPATAFSDVFGLAVVLENLYRDGIGLTEEKRSALEQALLDDSRKRLSFDRFQREFSRGLDTGAVSRTNSTVGRLISQSSETSKDVPSHPSSGHQLIRNSPGETKGGQEVALQKPSSTGGSWGILLGISCVFAVAMAGYSHWQPSWDEEEEIPYELYWKSEEPERMREVAVAAVKYGDEFAADTILSASSGEAASKYINQSILKLGLDPRWRNDLSLADKQTLLRVAVGALLPRSSRALTVTAETHPGVLFALLSQMNLDSTGSQFAHLKPEQLSTLPGFLGPAFSLIGKLGAKNLEDLTLRGLAHLFAGETTKNAFEAFFSTEDTAETTLAKLELLSPMILSDETFAEGTYDFLVGSEGVGQKLARWFQETSLASWKQVSKTNRMKVVLGDASGVSRSFELLADLLTFPRTSVREAALQKLLEDKTYTDSQEILRLLANPSNNKLTRTQTVSLLAALSAKGETSYSFVSKWFSSKPDPQMVAQLLSSYTVKRNLDSFQVQAAQYLTENRSKVTFSDVLLAKLSVHPEPLARALAYLQLKVENPEHRVILEKAVQVESNERMKKDLEDRLKVS